jgi:hypothetical protein
MKRKELIISTVALLLGGLFIGVTPYFIKIMTAPSFDLLWDGDFSLDFVI